MFDGFDFNVIERSWRYLFFDGMAFTLRLTLFAMAGGIVFGTLLAMMRLSSIKPLAWLAGTLREPDALGPAGAGDLLVLLPGSLHRRMDHRRSDTPIQVGAFASSLLTFTMFEAAYYCEIMRAGIQSISRGQVSAGYAIGLNYWQTMGQIVLPQAFRNMVPILLTQTIVLFQDVSLVYVLSITDFVGAASKVAQRDGRLVEMYTFVALIYFISCFALSLLVRRLQARIAIVR